MRGRIQLVRRECRPAFVALSFFASFGFQSSCRNPNDVRPALDEIWFVPQPGNTRSRPAASPNSVIFGSGDGSVIARDPATGAMRWKTTIAGTDAIHGARILIAGDVVIAEAEREVVALELSTGVIRWRFTPPVDTTGSGLPGYLGETHPEADASHVYVPAWGGSITAVSLANGQVKWTWQLGRLPSDTAANVFRSAAVGIRSSGDTLYATVWHFRSANSGPSEGILVALARATGNEFWKLSLPGSSSSVEGPPLLAAGFVILATANGFVHAVNPASQQIAWSFRSPQFQFATLGAPAVQAEAVYADGGDERVYALRASDGSVIWSAASRGATEDLLATSTRVYLVSDGALMVFDRSTGREVASTRLTLHVEVFETPPVAMSNQVFVTRTAGAWSFREP